MGMPIITNSGTSRCSAITDLIQSIALEETAVAHILNAEGEKIQKFTDKDANSTPEELLAVNQSVNDMVRNLTNFEIVLQSKLDIFKDCLCLDCDKGE